jgi:hypothetical protein
MNRVRTSSPLNIVCMNDISSTTGYILNGKLFSPGANYKLGEKRVGARMIVLRDGDTIQVPGTPQGTLISNIGLPSHSRPRWQNVQS